MLALCTLLCRKTAGFTTLRTSIAFMRRHSHRIFMFGHKIRILLSSYLELLTALAIVADHQYFLMRIETASAAKQPIACNSQKQTDTNQRGNYHFHVFTFRHQLDSCKIYTLSSSALTGNSYINGFFHSRFYIRFDVLYRCSI